MVEIREQPLVYALVVNWNKWQETMECVESVLRSKYTPFRLVVIDNGSDTDAAMPLPAGVEFLQTGSNLGYAGGINAGIRLALGHGAEYVWILNNDAQPDPYALPELVAAAEADAGWGALTSLILTLDGAEDAGLIGRLPDGERWDPVRRPYPIPPSSSTRASDCPVEQVDLLRGPSFLLRSAGLVEVGLFDESYFHYLEEMDLMERAVRAGWKLGLARRSVVRHAKGATLPYGTAQSLYYLHRNHFHYEQKLFGVHPIRVVLQHPIRRLRVLLSLRHTLRGDLRPLIAQARALADAVRGRRGRVDLGEHFLEPLSRAGGRRASQDKGPVGLVAMPGEINFPDADLPLGK